MGELRRRRQHRNSRNGCTACKQARKKVSRPESTGCLLSCQCDEGTPCGRCTRLSQYCSLLAHCPLMERYLKSTCNDISELCLNAGDLHIWRVIIPELSSQHPFLYHGMLSLSSLHQDRTIALEHHNKGLSLFRQSMDSDVEALFAFQCMLLVFSYGISDKNLLGLKTVVGVIRGSSVILSGGFIKDGPFKPILNLDVDGPRREVEWLTNRLNGSISASIYHDVYVKSIDLLRYALGVAPDPRYRQVVANNVWLLMPQEFLNLVWMGESLALAIMAGFGVAFHWSCDDNVFLKGWGRGIVRSVREMLGKEWDDCVEWAVKEVEGGVGLEEVSTYFAGRPLTDAVLT